MNFKRFLLLLTNCFLFCYLSNPLLSQNIKNRTIVKAGIESGLADLNQFFGDGLLYRAILRVQSRLQFSSALLQARGRFSKEYFNLTDQIKTLNQQGELLYVNYFKSGFYQLHASFNDHSSVSDSLGNQNIDEWQLDGLLNKGLTQILSVEIKNIYFARNFSFLNTQFNKNRLQMAANYKLPDNKVLGLGIFWDKLYLDNADTSASKDLFGFQIEYQLKKHFILNVIYNFEFVPAGLYNSHQLNCLMGKYLSKKWSLFVALFYTWIDDQKGDLELFNHVEVFNNINLKLSFDLFEDTNIYLKGILEDHKLVSYVKKITSTQFVLGIQQKL